MTTGAVERGAAARRTIWYLLALVALGVAAAAAIMLAMGVVPAWITAALARASLTGHYAERPGNALVMALLAGCWAAWAAIDLGRRNVGLAGVMPPRPLWLYAYGAGSMALFGLWHFALAPVPDWVWIEDGFYEYLTVVLLLATACVLALAARDAGRRRSRASAALIGFAAFVVVCFALEEISWGQRLLGLETPEGLAAINHQEEINVHNLFLGANDLIRLAAALVVATAFVLGRRLVRWLPWRALHPLVPDSRLAPYVVLFLIAVVNDELFEAIAAPFMLLYAADLRRRVVAGRDDDTG